MFGAGGYTCSVHGKAFPGVGRAKERCPLFFPHPFVSEIRVPREWCGLAAVIWVRLSEMLPFSSGL